ncbi:Protease Do-like 2 [Hibiscus syriacus]|uniref:Protease Do-like 2 n=1 Tax=Hibiscus syriacus TaxID=106335 RepID=A0A6A2Z422_HIBSY|nr:Protease Do-like 2 [Hibiscus syriacus]
MAITVANCCFSALSASFKSRDCHLRLANFTSTSLSCLDARSLKATNNKKRAPKKSSAASPRKSNAEKKLPGRLKDDKSSLYADGGSGKGGAGRPQSTGFKSFGTQRKEKKEFELDSREQQVEPGNFQDATFLNAVVKVYCTHTAPDYSLPWQKQRQYTSTGRQDSNLAFMIGDGKLLTNAHCVEHGTQVKVKRRGDDTKYVAKVLARGVDCDIALLSVESEEFWKGAEPLRLGHLPRLQDAVTVVGYPLGGDTISVTKGVVSRIEVTSYAHGSSDLLGIQIDAAINPGNSGGPAFNEQGECIGVAFQKLENPALRVCLQVQSNEGVLVRRVEPTSDANNVLKQGDVIVSFDDVHVGSEGTVPFRSNERIAFRYLISQKFAGDVAELGIIRAGKFMKVQVVLNPRVHLVPYHIDGDQPSYLIIAGLVFTPLSEPLIVEECEESIGLKLLAKARYSLARFKGEQIVILSQVLANEVNIGYEDMGNQQVLKFNGTRIKNIHHLAHLVACCQDKYMVFEFEDNYLAVLEREVAVAASACILKDYGIPSERSDDLLEPYVESLEDNQAAEHDFGDSPVSNLEIGFDGLLWA